MSAVGPNFPIEMSWERLILLSKKTFSSPRGCLLLVIELVHPGSSSILLVPFFGTPCTSKKGAPTTKAFCSDMAFSMTYINIEALVSLCVIMKGWHNLIDIPILNYRVCYSTFITKECSYDRVPNLQDQCIRHHVALEFQQPHIKHFLVLLVPWNALIVVARV